MKLPRLPCHAGDRRVRLAFQFHRRIRRVGGSRVGGGLRRWRGIETFLHPPVAVDPLLSVSWRGLVCAHVLGKVVVAHENPGAQSAAELLGAGVRLEVALQLVGTSESFAAEEPVADKRPISAVPSQVSLQVGRLGVGFAAARDVAVVHVLPPGVVGALAQLFGVDAVGTAAHGLGRTPGRGAALGLGTGGDDALLRLFQGELFLLEHFRGQGFHLESILGEQVGRVRGWSVLYWRQGAELRVRTVRT